MHLLSVIFKPPSAALTYIGPSEVLFHDKFNQRWTMRKS